MTNQSTQLLIDALTELLAAFDNIEKLNSGADAKSWAAALDRWAAARAAAKGALEITDPQIIYRVDYGVRGNDRAGYEHGT